MKDLAKNYARLTADERFRLFMQAATRKDYLELDRLNNSCPRKTYVCDDNDYTKRKLNFLLIRLWQEQELRRIEQYCSLALIAGISHEDEGDATGARIADQAIDIFVQAMRMRSAKIQAWRQFCEKIGLPADTPTAIGCDAGSDDWMMRPAEGIAADLGDAEPDSKDIERSQNDLHGLWTHLATPVR